MTQARKRIRKLSTAVFRGNRTEYNFDVFPISPWITDAAAVFIFSRRFVDKHGRAHHAVSCLGEAKSVVTEIKRHKRSKCVKERSANVVCVLKEADQNSRTAVVQDISEGRQFSCVRGSYKPLLRPAPAKRHAKTPTILDFKPAQTTGAKMTETSKSKTAPTKRTDRAHNQRSRSAASNGNIKIRNSDDPKRGVETDPTHDAQPRKASKIVSRNSRRRIASDTRGRAKRAA